MNPFKNLSLNLEVTGPAAVLIVWFISVTLLGLYGSGDMADTALNILALAGGMILTALAFKA